ncbi:MAG: DUF1289 domain-containing protein [Burkholderiaceae bacterium]|nr:DUF1289 domain-containing protein [Roseateles sp.]MBV8470410.1 DUF1289 domain-containing protein [Burkholderiaceae bacterium]
MSSIPLPSADPVTSPCSSVCRMHAATGFCEGCARTIDEIIQWSAADDATRREILLRLPARRELLVSQGIFTAVDPDGMP